MTVRSLACHDNGLLIHVSFDCMLLITILSEKIQRDQYFACLPATVDAFS